MKFKTLSIIMLLALALTCMTPVCAFADDELNSVGTDISVISEETVSVGVPENVKAKASGKTVIKISWSKVEDADGYKVYRYSRTKGEYILIKTTSSLSYKDTGLTPNRKKTYKVAAYITADGKTVTGDKSAKVSATTNPRTIRVKAYAYTGGGYTASGLKARRGLIAVDRSVIRLGTKVYVPGYGYAVAADTGGAIKGNIIDCYMNSMSDCTAWGVRFVTIRIYD